MALTIDVRFTGDHHLRPTRQGRGRGRGRRIIGTLLGVALAASPISVAAAAPVSGPTPAVEHDSSTAGPGAEAPSTPAAAFTVEDPVAAAYETLGGRDGRLGEPISALEMTTPTTGRQYFEHGWIDVDGELASAVLDDESETAVPEPPSEGSGPVGGVSSDGRDRPAGGVPPSAPDFRDRLDGSRTSPESSSVPSAIGEGAAVVPMPAAVESLYLQLGGRASSLGTPVAAWVAEPRRGESADRTSRGFQLFTGGVVYTDTATYAVIGSFDSAHRQRGGGTGELGYPRGALVTQSPGGSHLFQVFENGVVYGSPAGTLAVVAGWDDRHRTFGGGGGVLGYPTSPVVAEGQSRAFQIFERGVLYSSAAGIVAVTGSIDSTHRARGGGLGELGYPTQVLEMQNTAFGFQVFERGVIYASPRGVHVVGAPIDAAHRRTGGGSGALGYPVAGKVFQGGSNAYQVFERGVVYDSPNGVFPVTGGLDEAHRARGGGGGALGYPRGVATLRGAGTQCQSFDRGNLALVNGVWTVSPTGSWFLSPALASLRSAINAAHPARDRSSDGTVGDLAHQTRVSDHNPDRGACDIVRALDIDRDLGTGDPAALAEALTRDTRVAYVIFRSRIWLQSSRAWRPYTGSNPHETHIHVSLRHGVDFDHGSEGWALS